MDDFRLVYIWIENYKNIEKKGLHFTLDYKICFNDNISTSTSISATLGDFGHSSQGKENPLNHLDRFSAVVGKNGSGKSNLLELLNHIVCLGCFPSEENKALGFIILETKQKNSQSQLCMISNDNHYTFESGNVVESFNFHMKKVIYYNPIDHASKPKNINLDGNKLYQIDHNPIKSNYKNTSTTKNIYDFSSFKEGLEKYDIFKTIFENSYASYILQYEEIKSVAKSKLNGLAVGRNAIRFGWFSLLSKEMQEIINSKNFSFEHFSLCYYFLSSAEFLRVENENGAEFKYHTDDISLLFAMLNMSFDATSEIKEAEERAEQFLIKNNLKEVFVKFRQRISATLEILKNLSSCFKFNETYGGYIRIPCSDKDSFKYLNHLVKGNQLENIEPNLVRGEGIFSSVGIEGLSSGELNIVNFIGNLENALDNFNNIEPVIFFDEVEHTFHPEWQRLLIHTLNKVFSNKNVNPQVVMTTHSPFILSDILNHKALSLDYGNSNNLKSFAANIHDILSSDFFMKRSIGESAAELIGHCCEMIESIKGTNFEPASINKIKMIIEQINDPIIKSELNSRLSVATTNITEIRGQILELMQGNLSDVELTSEIKKLL